MENDGGSFESARAMPNSVELTRNAKGDYQWTIKRYYDGGEEMAALTEIQLIDVSLRDTYLPPALPL